jgi:hypothetical protein
MMFTEALPRTEVFPVPLCCCWFVDANLEGSQRGALHSHDRIVELLAMRDAGDGVGLGIPLPEQFRSGIQPHGAVPTSTLRKSAQRLGAPSDYGLLIQ